MPEVSVIMPSYNCGAFIGQSIASVLNQSVRDIELIVVDDGSTDDTPERVRPFLKDKRFRFMSGRKNRGPSAARNAGMESARGNMIAFLDADDLFLKSKIEVQLELLGRKKDYGACYTGQVYFDGETGMESASKRRSFSGDVFYFLKRSNFIPVCAVMIRRKALGNYKFDESPRVIGHEDWEYFLRLASRGVKFWYIDRPLSRIRVRTGSVTTTSGMQESRKNVGLLAKSYWRVFKKSMHPLTQEGQKAIMRYAAMKTRAILIGFPERACFNEPVPQEKLIGQGV